MEEGLKLLGIFCHKINNKYTDDNKFLSDSLSDKSKIVKQHKGNNGVENERIIIFTRHV